VRADPPQRPAPQLEKVPVPTGKVKWFDADKGFGFLAAEDGAEVFVHASALPTGTQTLSKGSRVEFGVVQGKNGTQALSVRLLDPVHSVARATRKKPEDVVPIVEDLIKLLDGLSGSLRRGRYPDASGAKKVATVLRAVADDVEAGA
jgi:CspA family cold shock protein